MRGSSAPSLRAGRVAVTIDLALCTIRDRQLAVLLARGHSRWTLPHLTHRAGRAPAASAVRLAVAATGRRPAWLDHLGVFGDARGRSELDVAYVGVAAPTSASSGAGCRWFTTESLPFLSSRHRAIVQAAIRTMRERMEHAPVAFGLLPQLFTLGALQATYELLLDRRLHKASFRRALHAARVVEPTDEWRSEGRGRPAQLFRYAPRPRRAGVRGVRFELLGR